MISIGIQRYGVRRGEGEGYGKGKINRIEYKGTRIPVLRLYFSLVPSLHSTRRSGKASPLLINMHLHA